MVTSNKFCAFGVESHSRNLCELCFLGIPEYTGLEMLTCTPLDFDWQKIETGAWGSAVANEQGSDYSHANITNTAAMTRSRKVITGPVVQVFYPTTNDSLGFLGFVRG